MSQAYTYPSVVFQGLTFTAKRWGHFPTISYTTGATAGLEVVTTDSNNNIFVQIATGVSTTVQVKTAIEATSPSSNGLSAGDLVSIVISTPGVVTAPATSSAMTGAVAPNILGFFVDNSITALTSSYVYFPFAIRHTVIVIHNDETAGNKQVIFSWDGINNHGILDPGESVTLDNANMAAIFLKYGNGAPVYRVFASGTF